MVLVFVFGAENGNFLYFSAFYFSAEKEFHTFGIFYFSAENGKSVFGRPLHQLTANDCFTGVRNSEGSGD